MYENVCRLLLENGARLVYTGSRAVGDTLKRLGKDYPSFHSEASQNEKIAFELALTGSYVTKRTACIFTTDGIYEALDPLMSSAYTGVIGGFLVICMKETDEEVTPLGPFSKLPVIVAEDMESLTRAVTYGYTLSEKYEIPVIIQAAAEAAALSSESEVRSKAKSNHSKLDPLPSTLSASQFTKNPGRWAATPKFRFQLHKELNGKIESIRGEFAQYAGNVSVMRGKTGVITDRRSSMQFYEEDVSMLYLSTVYPLPHKLVEAFIEKMDEVFVAEGTCPAIELQISERKKVRKGLGLRKMRSRKEKEETMYGFKVVRDTLGPGSAINMAHGMKKLDPDRKVLAITQEDHFFHSGMPAFVNTLYNNSSYLLVIMTNEKEQKIGKVLEGCGFHNFFHIDNVSEIEKYKGKRDLTVLFCRGIA
jgi:TPP-dependent indolepyruvate ferredoxin oxidoreductase alpha subunit